MSVVLLWMPLVWSALAYGLHQRTAAVDERRERQRLAVVLAPAGLGLAFLVAAWCWPVSIGPPSPFSIDILSEGGPGEMNPAEHATPIRGGWGPLWLAVYALGFLVSAARLMAAQRRIRRITAQARPVLAPGSSWSHSATLPKVATTAEPVTPLVGPDGTIIVPDRLWERLSPDQVGLIIAHEQNHIDRCDPWYFAILAWLDAAFWFNPWLRRQTARCRLAAEVAVDDAVLRHAPERRRLYASALIETLKLNAQPAPANAALVSLQGEHKMRLNRILRPQPPSKGRMFRMVLIAALAVPFGTVQWAFADEAAGRSVSLSIVPLKGKVTSRFGELPNKRNRRTRNHTGIDIKAKRGTPVVAAAAGRVKSARFSKSGYGNLVILEHGDGVATRYAHLSTFDVKAGDVVRAGQRIARVGSTGLSTGPHLHFEVVVNGEVIDPETVLSFP